MTEEQQAARDAARKARAVAWLKDKPKQRPGWKWTDKKYDYREDDDGRMG